MADEVLSLILVTAPSHEVAHQLAQGLVTERLAACVTVVPQVMSLYRWEGHLEQVSEILMLIKKCHARDSAVEAYLRAHHPYHTPEIVEIPAGRVTARYRDWIVQETTEG